MSSHTADRDARRQLVEQFGRFYRQYYNEEIADLARLYPKDRKSLTIDWRDLFKFDPDLADDWLENPEQLREYAEEALRVHDTPIDQDLGGAHVRVTGLNEQDIISTAEINADKVGRFIGIEGRVRKKSQKTPVPEEAVFECKRCGTLTPISQSGPGDDIQEPHECQGCERQGPFTLKENQTDWKDRQMVRIQQPAEETKGGTGASRDVVLEDDAVSDLGGGGFQPGATVTVTGECSIIQDDGTDYYIRGDVIEEEDSDFGQVDITQSDIDRIRAIANGAEGDPYEVATETLASGIYGFEEEKLALLLQLFRGVRSQLPDGSWERGDIHVLFIGDPSTGKSSLLRRVTELSPQSSFASGAGASAAGLTAAAVPSDFGDAKWDIQAGALVLADQGVAAIDEIDKVDDDAVRSLHDALESPQVVEVNKADKDATLPSRTSLVAAGNPKHGRFNPKQPIAEQCDIESPLMTRFDLIFTVMDEPDKEFDTNMAEHTIRRRQTGHEHYHHQPDSAEPPEEVATPIDEEIFRKWIAYARQNYFPRIDTDDGELVGRLVELYTSLRAKAYDTYDDSTPIPVTARKLEAFQRLAEASARIRLSNTVEEQDIERAAKLVLSTLKDVGVDQEGQFDADVVETGMSTKSRNYKQFTEDLLDEIAETNELGDIPIEEIKDRLDDHDDVRWSDVDYCISKLKAKGLLYEPQSGVLRWNR